MDGNPEGTPNPLNPTPGTASAGNEPQPSVETAAGTGTAVQSEPVQPASFAQNSEPTTITGLTAEPTDDVVAPIEAAEPTGLVAEPIEVKTEATPVAPEPTMPEPAASEPVTPKFTAPRPVPKMGGAIDPMMRRVPKQPAETLSRSESSVDPLGMTNETIDELRATPAPETPDLVAKDSIVDGGKKSGKKKAFVISAIVLLMIAIICGAAAIAVALVNNNGSDRVSQAIEKLLNGQTSNIVSLQGKIAMTAERLEVDAEEETSALESNLSETVASSDENCIEGVNCIEVEETDTSVSLSLVPFFTNMSVDFDGTFDFNSSVNKVSAEMSSELEDGNELALKIDELTTKDGSTYFKLSGLSDIATSVTSGSEMLAFYAGLLGAMDDEWILATDSASDSIIGGITMVDSTATCLLSEASKLSNFSKDLAEKYKANSFITYTADNLKISKRKNNLYRLGINNDKMTAFVNSLNGSSLAKEVASCAGTEATTPAFDSSAIRNLISNFSNVYVEVDENNNFTRIYVEAKNEVDNVASTAKLDLNISYPTELRVTEPSEYTSISELFTRMMTNAIITDTEEIPTELPENF